MKKNLLVLIRSSLYTGFVQDVWDAWRGIQLGCYLLSNTPRTAPAFQAPSLLPTANITDKTSQEAQLI